MESFYIQLVVLLLILLAIWVFWSGTRVHELAVQHARVVCRENDLQLLDQTVALQRLRPVRLSNGRRGVRREYRFEFTLDGITRDHGKVIMRGQSLEAVVIPRTGTQHTVH